MALNATFNNVYKLGDQATYVKEIIKKLNALSYHCGTPDIYYTSLVAQRVKDFQRDHNLNIDGKVGPLTHKKLYEATPTTNSRPILRQGASGSAVRDAQNLLTKFGFTCTCDGKFGAKTKAQVIAFQKKNGLSADGVVGAKTWAKLYQENNVVAPPKTSTGRPIVRKGDQNEYVGQLQEGLLRLGYLTPTNHTGRYDDTTYNAVRRFQQTYGLVAEGIVGPKTWEALDKMNNRGNTQPNLAHGDGMGSSDPAVKRLQQRLVALGYNVGSAGSDGQFGQATLAAVKLFQAANGMLQTGEVDQAFWATLNSSTAKAPGYLNSINCKMNDRGEMVKLIQSLLGTLGYSVGSAGIDGVFGQATYNAVVDFQTDKRLLGQAGVTKGVVGDKTMRLLTDANESIKKDAEGFLVLRKGMRDSVIGGTRITDMQIHLKNLQYDIGTTGADGIFGDKTYNALTLFQVQNKIIPSGEYNTETARYLTAKHKVDGREQYVAKPADYHNAQTEQLKMGSVGKAVEAAQKRLIVLGYYCGSTGADTIFGIHTYNAVCSFQRNNGLQVDGIIGVKTFAKLFNDPNAVKSSGGSVGGTTPPIYVYNQNVEDAANNLVKVARAQIGYIAETSKRTKYGEWYNSMQKGDYDYSTDAWCNMFVSWCAHMAGILEKLVPLSSSTEATRTWFMNRNAFHAKETYTPRKGDSIYFRFKDHPKYNERKVTHVGIVEAVMGNRVYAIEGNRTVKGRKKVAQFDYSLTDSEIVGYGNIRAVHSQLPLGSVDSKVLCNNSMDARDHIITMTNVQAMCKNCDYSAPRPSYEDKIKLFAEGTQSQRKSYFIISALQLAFLDFSVLKASGFIPKKTASGLVHNYSVFPENCLRLIDEERRKHIGLYHYNNRGITADENYLLYRNIPSSYFQNDYKPKIQYIDMEQRHVSYYNGSTKALLKLIFDGIVMAVSFIPVIGTPVALTGLATSLVELLVDIRDSGREWDRESLIELIISGALLYLEEKVPGAETLAKIAGGIFDGALARGGYDEARKETAKKDFVVGDKLVKLHLKTNDFTKGENWLEFYVIFDANTGRVKDYATELSTPEGLDTYDPTKYL